MNQSNQPVSIDHVKVRLLNYLTQELLTPLTSLMGMASVLSKEIYGPLTPKQREYVDVMNHSSKVMKSIVHEILNLSSEEDQITNLDNSGVNIESLCQQVINNLKLSATRYQQEIKLSLSSNGFTWSSTLEANQTDSLVTNLWCLDQEQLKKMLHHLLLGMIETADAGCTIHLHVTQTQTKLELAVWVSHPLLGDSLPLASIAYFLEKLAVNLKLNLTILPTEGNRIKLSFANLEEAIAQCHNLTECTASYHDRELLRLLISCQLLEAQGGQLWLEGSSESGFKYILTIPCHESNLAYLEE